MDVLRKADRRVLWWAIAAFVLLWLLGAFWVMHGVEDPLTERAQGIDSFEAVDGATIEFNGRDGYLAVPEGTANAEQIASDIADIRGVRDVEIEVLGAATGQMDEVEEPPTTQALDPEPEEAVVESTPAVFGVTWDEAGATQSGDAPDDLSGAVAALGVASPLTGSDLTVGPAVDPTLSALAPLIGTDLQTGSVDVDDGTVVIRGTAADQAAFDRATEALADVDATVELDIAAPPEDDGALEADSAQTAFDELLALDKIEFVTATSIPTDATETIIDEVAATLTEFPDVSVVITGHTDAQGPEPANQLLSEQRAQAVVDGLVARGIDPARLQASGKGETEPIETNDTPEGRQSNRRVEIDVEENG